MGTLILADDEPLVLELLKKLIDYSALDLHVIGEASDGPQALAMILEHKPDIVITDIRMPGVDGLEIVRRVREQGNLRTKFVIISGHKHFDYAYSAIKFGVEDYLLKPIGKEELNKTLLKLQKQIGQMNEHEQSAKSTRSAARERMLLRMLMGDKLTPDLSELNAKNNFHFQEGFFLAAVVALDIEGDPERDAAILPIVQKKLSDEFAKNYEGCFDLEVIHVDTRSQCVLNFSKEKPEAGHRTLKYVFERMVGALEQYDFLHISMGVGVNMGSPSELPKSLALAEAALDNRIFSGVDALYTAKDELSGAARQDAELLALPWHQLPPILDTYHEARLLAWVDEALGSMKRDSLSAKQRMHLYHAFVKRFLQAASESGFSTALIGESRMRIERQLKSAFREQEIESLLRNELCTLLATCRDQKRTQDYLPILRTKQFIQEHFAEEIYLDALAGRVGLSSTYLSSLFKKEAGVTVSDYILLCRMNTAKALLLDCRLNVSDVAYKVGYSDPKHFSKVFKAHTGILPLRFRMLNS
jgi:two-component system response regulator YesN